MDQEQGSTRGNIEVIHHYFLRILNLPKDVFERIIYFILGDRLTTAHDHAAQDQRAVDTSPHRFDHLSSFAMTSGLMHHCLNMIRCIGGNSWGGANGKDAMSLMTLRDLLPNYTEINTRSVDFYAWLRFLDIVLRSMVIRAACVTSNCDTVEDLARKVSPLSPTAFMDLATTIADTYVLQSIDRLEDIGLKPVFLELEQMTACHVCYQNLNILGLTDVEVPLVYAFDVQVFENLLS